KEEDDYGKIFKINLKDIKDASKFGLIMRKGDWAAKDIDQDRFIDLTKAVEVDGKKVVHVYLHEGDQTIYYNEADVDLTPRLSSATFNSLNKIMLKASAPFDIIGDKVEGIEVKDSAGNSVELDQVLVDESTSTVIALLKNGINLEESYTISKDGFKEAINVSYDGLFDTQEFHDAYFYEGDDLGFTYSKEETAFRVWAPTASNVLLNLYSEGNGDNLIETIQMSKDTKGTWIAKVSGDINMTYYTYTVTVSDQTNEAVDPYARAVGVNGDRAMVIDLDSTDPKDFATDKAPEFSGEPTDAVIYELHMRDLSSDISSGIKNVGKFLQFTEEGTKSPEGLATGLDHLKELGITHLHLLPAFDHRSIDENRLDDLQFNWGYDPQHYTVPEGSYSTDPYNGEVRINEFKQMVQSLHSNGIRVVMDVVYNHTGATADSDFNKIVPGYYYRQDANGGFANGSGCGNETASDRLMMSKYIVESVKYWATEYHIDGFRFDLMALHDIETMNAVRAALNEIDPSIIVYGEGWNAGGSPLPQNKGAFKIYASQMPGIAMFSDDIRDGVKGSVFNAEEPGFVNGKFSFDERVKFGIVGATQHPQIDYNRSELAGGSKGPWATQPGQSINYVSAHDNNTLWDKLLATNPDTDKETLKLMQKQANAIVLTAQGVPFLHAGVEMLRTKDGDHNSYNASDEVNKIDWTWKSDNKEVYDYYQGLIALRKAHPAFRMSETSDIQTNLAFFDEMPVGVIGFNLGNHANGDTASDITVIHNASTEAQVIKLPKEGDWKLVVNGEKAGTDVIETVSTGEVTVTPHSSYVLMLDSSVSATTTNSALLYGGIALVAVVASLGAVAFMMNKKKKAK
ncbi:MAG: type I pullulanase, partial [Turicibacter sp.]